MLKEHANIFRRFVILFDASLIVACFLLARFIRIKFFPGLFLYNFFFQNYYIWSLPIIVLLWIALLYILGMYRSLRLKTPSQIARIIFLSGLYCFAILASMAYILKIESISRSFMGLFFIFTGLMLMLEKWVILFIFYRLRERGFNFRNILLVGVGQRAQRFAQHLHKHRELGLKIVGFIDEDATMVGQTINQIPVMGSINEVPRILKENIIDSVIIIVPRGSLDKVEDVISYCELVGVSANVAVDLFNPKITTIKESNIMGIPMITFETVPHSVMALMIKRMIDIVASLLGLILIAPIYFMVALAIKLTSPGPVYFKQERVGLNGRRFELYKFRTMVIDAEERLAELMKHNQMSGPAFKMENDPRITKIGGFLRKFSLDELPQLWNVLHGDMSLVGPRPPLPREVKQYEPWHQRRLSMRPGITCIWQVGGRNRISDFDDWVRLDLKYIDNWSLLLDFKILLQTIPAVLSTKGAK